MVNIDKFQDEELNRRIEVVVNWKKLSEINE